MPSQFVKSLVYHILFAMILGPMTFGILICFEKVAYLRNMGFIPGMDSDTMMYFMQQTMVWMMFVGIIAMAVKNRMDAANDEDSEKKVLDLWPLYIVVI